MKPATMKQSKTRLVIIALAFAVASAVCGYGKSTAVYAANRKIEQGDSHARLFVRWSGYDNSFKINDGWYAAGSAGDAQAQANAMCSVGQRIGFGAWVSNISWVDQNNGIFSYTVHMYARSCGAGRTRMFAITGYPTASGFHVCPVAGYWRYLGSGSTRNPNSYGETYDCMKFQNASDLYGRIGNRTGSSAVNWSTWGGIQKGGSWSQPSTGGTYTEATFNGQIPAESWASDEGEFTFLNNAAIGSYYWETNGNGGLQHIKCGNCVERRDPGHASYNDSDDIVLSATIRWKTDTDVPKPGPAPSDGAESQVRTDKHSWDTYIGTGRPGQNAQWRHRVNVICNGSVNNNSFSSGVTKSGDWSSSRSFAIRCGDNTNYSPQKKLVADDTRKTYCENAWYKYTYTYTYTYYDGDQLRVRKEDRSVSHTTNSACVYIPYHIPGCQGNGCSPSEECRNGDGSACSNTSLSQSGVVGSADIISGGTSISGGTVSYEQPIDFKYTFNNRYGPSKSPDVTYTAHIFTLEGELDPTTNYRGFDHDPTPEELISSHRNGYFVNETFPGSTGELNPGTSTTKNHGGRNVSNALGQPGDQICTYVVMGTNASMVNDKPSNTYVASPMKCVRIAKRPQLQINGSDSYAGGGFNGTTYNGDALRGSYTQYSQLTNKGASSLFGSAGYTNQSGDNWYRMIYADAAKASDNASDHLSSGNLDKAYLTSEVITRLGAARNFALNDLHVLPTSTNSLDINTLASDKFNNIVVNPSGGTLNIAGAGAAKAGAIMVNGNAVVTGNIGNMDSYNDSGMLTIYATGNISINAGVQLIHANLVAGGKVITCSEAGGTNGTKTVLGQSDAGTCKNKLKVNGAVVSEASPAFQRTFGAGSCEVSRQGRTCQAGYTGEPQYNYWWIGATSEWLNYTPDSWYLANKMINGDRLKSYQTTTVLSRPTRY